MSDIKTLFDRNRKYARSLERGSLPAQPRFSAVVLACMDHRADPTLFLGLAPAEANVLRTAGGRVAGEVACQLALLAHLGGWSGAENGAPLELAIVHHTDCRMEGLRDPARRRKISGATGIEESTLEALAISDHTEALREDVERLRASPLMPRSIIVSGYLYDVVSGAARLVVEPAPLG